MKWKKLGKIFDPTEHRLPNRCKEFAQSPQALVLKDRVRIFFSTRELDGVGKYLSHVAYVDFSRDMGKIIDVSKRPVLPLGGLGTFDEHGIFPFSVFRDGDRVLAFTTGWSRRVSVSVDGAIGLASSNDEGLSFQRHGSGPVMAASLNEPFLVGDGFVRRYDDRFHMWYIYGTMWKRFGDSGPLDRVYKIAHATSWDGMQWQRDGRQIIGDRLDANECQALPTVICLNGTFHMYFCYRQAYGFRHDRSRAYRLGYARSTDLIDWSRLDGEAGIDVGTSGWDVDMQCYPHMFTCDGSTYLLYNGNEFGRFGFGIAILES